MSLQQEIKKLAVAVLADLRTAMSAADVVAASPMIAPLIPVMEQAVIAILAAHGVPAAEVERIGQQLFAGILGLLTAAAGSGTIADPAPVAGGVMSAGSAS